MFPLFFSRVLSRLIQNCIQNVRVLWNGVIDDKGLRYVDLAHGVGCFWGGSLVVWPKPFGL